MRQKGVRTGAALVALLVLAGCGRDAPKDDAGPSRSTTSTTTHAPLACHESSAGLQGASRSSATFGPLGAEPSVVIHLPTFRRATTTATTYVQDTYPSVAWTRLDGATVVAAAPPYTSESDASLVTAVDDDGSVRWTRCLDGVVVGVGGGEDADLVAVVIRAGAGNDASLDGQLLLLDASDGTQRAGHDGANQLLASSNRWALVGRVDPDGSGPTDVRLVDLTGGESTAVEHPPVPVDPPHFELTDDGKLTVDGKVWHDGEWVNDPDPPTVVDFESDPSTLVAKTGDRVEWRVPAAHPGLEGPSIARGDRTVVAWTCGGARAADGHCPLALVGVDIASGQVLWTRPGEQYLGVGGGDAFLALEDDVWTLRSMRTGVPIGGQRWADRNAFLQGCCGDYEYYRVERFGGTVLVLGAPDVRIWFPKARSHATVDVRP